MNREDAVKVLKSLVECLSIDCDDDCEHCHIQLDGITAVVEACTVAVIELSQIDTDMVSRQFMHDLGATCIARRDEGDDLVAIVGIDLLPPASESTEQQAICEYCHEDAEGYVRPVEKNNHAFVRFGITGWELSLKGNGWHGEAPIHFCPMCGRNLQQEVLSND